MGRLHAPLPSANVPSSAPVATSTPTNRTIASTIIPCSFTEGGGGLVLLREAWVARFAAEYVMRLLWQKLQHLSIPSPIACFCGRPFEFLGGPPGITLMQSSADKPRLHDPHKIEPHSRQ
jgi:hypothetical protein